MPCLAACRGSRPYSGMALAVVQLGASGILFLPLTALQRLINMVDNALLRWAANTGHYEAVEPLMRRQPPGLGRGAGGTAAVSAGSGSAGGATAEAAAGATAQVPAGGEVLRL